MSYLLLPYQRKNKNTGEIKTYEIYLNPKLIQAVEQVKKGCHIIMCDSSYYWVELSATEVLAKIEQANSEMYLFGN